MKRDTYRMGSNPLHTNKRVRNFNHPNNNLRKLVYTASEAVSAFAEHFDGRNHYLYDNHSRRDGD